jgi:hypothetical protein
MDVPDDRQELETRRNQWFTANVFLLHTAYTGRFIMFSVVTNIYNKKTKGSTLMELFTATGKLNFFLATRDVRCVHHK